MATPLYDANDKRTTEPLGGGPSTSGPAVARAKAKGASEVATELWDLLKRYAKQETIDPLKGIGRLLAFGAAGSLLLSIGVVFLVLGLLRLLQTQTGPHLTGHLTWVPYLAALAVAALLIALAVRAITKTAKTDVGRSKAGDR